MRMKHLLLPLLALAAFSLQAAPTIENAKLTNSYIIGLGDGAQGANSLLEKVMRKYQDKEALEQLPKELATPAFRAFYTKTQDWEASRKCKNVISFSADVDRLIQESKAMQNGPDFAKILPLVDFIVACEWPHISVADLNPLWQELMKNDLVKELVTIKETKIGECTGIEFTVKEHEDIRLAAVSSATNVHFFGFKHTLDKQLVGAPKPLSPAAVKALGNALPKSFSTCAILFPESLRALALSAMPAEGETAAYRQYVQSLKSVNFSAFSDAKSVRLRIAFEMASAKDATDLCEKVLKIQVIPMVGMGPMFLGVDFPAAQAVKSGTNGNVAFLDFTFVEQDFDILIPAIRKLAEEHAGTASEEGEAE